MPTPRLKVHALLSATLVRLLDGLAEARPKTVPVAPLVEAYFQLQEEGHGGEAERVLAHLVTEKNGYVDIVRYEARKWKNSGHNGFGEDDLMQVALIKITQGLRNGQRSALNWRSFCYARFKDAKGSPELNGYRGGRAKVEKQIQRVHVGSGGADGDRGPGAGPYPDAPGSAPAFRLEPELLEMFRPSDLRQQVEDDDLDTWGTEIVDRLIRGVGDEEVEYVAREQFCADGRPLTGPPDETGLLSVAEERGWPDYKAKYLKKRARAYLAERLLRLIVGPALGTGTEIERAWLRTWFNKHELERGLPPAPGGRP